MTDFGPNHDYHMRRYGVRNVYDVGYLAGWNHASYCDAYGGDPSEVSFNRYRPDMGMRGTREEYAEGFRDGVAEYRGGDNE